LFFELLPKPLERSAILVADEELNPPVSLVENAGVAGEDFLKESWYKMPGRQMVLIPDSNS